MATVTSNLHISDSDRPSLRLFSVGEGRYALSLDARNPGSNDLSVFATLDQLEALARELDRMVILARADQVAPELPATEPEDDRICATCGYEAKHHPTQDEHPFEEDQATAPADEPAKELLTTEDSDRFRKIIPAHMVGCHNWTAEELASFLRKHPAYTARQVHWAEHNAGHFPEHSPNDWRPL